MWQDIPKVHELFNDMMNQAHEELDFAVAGPVAVEVFSLPAQGMVVIVTRGTHKHEDDDILEQEDRDFYELEVTLDESEDILFAFDDFEHVIQVAHKLQPFVEDGGRLLQYNSRYFLLFEDLNLEESVFDLLIAILSEFGEPSTQSKFILNEYGSVLIGKEAVTILCKHFKL
jgi:adapter protein MecA 1/2